MLLERILAQTWRHVLHIEGQWVKFLGSGYFLPLEKVGSGDYR